MLVTSAVDDLPPPAPIDRWLLLVSTVERLSAAQSLDQIIRIVHDTARAISGADGVTFVLRDGDQCHYVDEDAIGPLWRGRRFPLTACISGWCMLNGKAAVIPDIYADDRIPHDAYRPTFVKSLVMTPVRVEDPLAAIGAYWAERRTFTDEELALLEGLARSTAAAIAAVQARESLHQNEQRLRAAVSQLAHADRLGEMGKMSSALAHELNQPLSAANVYLGGARRLLEGDDAEASRPLLKAAVDKAQAQLSRSAEVIRRLRRFIGKGEPVRERADVALLVAEALDIIKVDPRWADADLTLTLDDDLPPALADGVQIQQVVLNLVRNGLEAMGEAPVKAVTVTVSASPEGRIELRVADRGPGVRPEVAGRLFQPFVSSKPDGMGMGLALCREIVEDHGGRLWVEDNPGGGAVFAFSLPAADASA